MRPLIWLKAHHSFFLLDIKHVNLALNNNYRLNAVARKTMRMRKVSFKWQNNESLIVPSCVACLKLFLQFKKNNIHSCDFTYFKAIIAVQGFYIFMMNIMFLTNSTSLNDCLEVNVTQTHQGFHFKNCGRKQQISSSFILNLVIGYGNFPMELEVSWHS